MVRKFFAATSILLIAATIVLGIFWPRAFWLLVVILPLVALGLYDVVQRKHTILRIYPVIGHLRWR